MSEEITDQYHVQRREFLNEYPDLPAYIIGIVGDTREIPDDQPKRWTDGEIILDLADCYRRVRLDFDMYNCEVRAHSLRKINLIAEVVNAVRDAIALEVESHNARSIRLELAKEEEEPAKIEDSRAQYSTSHFTTLGL